MTLNELIQKLEEVKSRIGGEVEVLGINKDTFADGKIANVGYDDYSEDELDWQNNEDVTRTINFAYIKVEF